jgi:hypothetical protein
MDNRSVRKDQAAAGAFDAHIAQHIQFRLGSTRADANVPEGLRDDGVGDCEGIDKFRDGARLSFPSDGKKKFAALTSFWLDTPKKTAMRTAAPAPTTILVPGARLLRTDWGNCCRCSSMMTSKMGRL